MKGKLKTLLDWALQVFVDVSHKIYQISCSLEHLGTADSAVSVSILRCC